MLNGCCASNLYKKLTVYLSSCWSEQLDRHSQLLIYEAVNLWSCWSMKLLIYEAVDLSSCWSIQLLIYPAVDLSSCWSIQLLIYPAVDLSSSWSIQLLIYPAVDLPSSWSIQLLIYPAVDLSSCWSIQLLLSWLGYSSASREDVEAWPAVVQQRQRGLRRHLPHQRHSEKWRQRQPDSSRSTALPKEKKGGIFWINYLFMYVIQHCFICRPSDSTCRRMLGSTARTVATWHWQPDALITRLDLIHARLDLIPKEDYMRKICTRNSFPQKKQILPLCVCKLD